MSSELVAKTEQLSKAVTALTEFNRELHKALKEISAPDLSQLKVSVDLSTVVHAVEKLETSVAAIGELQAEQDEKLNKIGELLFKFLEQFDAPEKQEKAKG